MVGWHHWLGGHYFEQMQGDSEGQGSLACCSPWGHKELDMTEWLNNSNKEKEAIKWKMTFSTHKTEKIHRTFCCSSVTKSCLTLCDSVDCSTPGSLVLHCLSEFFHCHLPPSIPAHRELLKTFSTLKKLNTYCCCSVTRLCLILCNPMGCSTPGFPVLHCLPEFAQTHVHWINDAIQPSHPLSPPSPSALNLSQDQGLF